MLREFIKKHSILFWVMSLSFNSSASLQPAQHLIYSFQGKMGQSQEKVIITRGKISKKL